MRDEEKTKGQLIKELRELRHQVSDLEGALNEQVREDKSSLMSTPQKVRTILVVDDNDTVRNAMLQVLHSGGYQTLDAQNAEQTVSLIEQYDGPIHLILTDVVMPPGVSGRELIEHIRPMKPMIKVLFMSGYSEDLIINEDVNAILESGEEFLEKPISAEILLKKVREMLDEKRIS